MQNNPACKTGLFHVLQCKEDSQEWRFKKSNKFVGLGFPNEYSEIGVCCRLVA